jgi:hypothetical protein
LPPVRRTSTGVLRRHGLNQPYDFGNLVSDPAERTRPPAGIVPSHDKPLAIPSLKTKPKV